MKRDAASELQQLENVFASLAHASRRHIMLVLHLHGGSMTAGEIARRFDCSWPTTTRHLKQLEDAGLVEVEQRGRERVYALKPEVLAHIAGGWLARFTTAAEPPTRLHAARRARRRKA
jgi:DNA-binding transcriptional ArsR family regulator